MKKAALVCAIAVGLIGCAHDRHYSEYRDGHYVTEYRDGERVYVRADESDSSNDSYTHMQPQFQGKAPEALGWNTENYYRQRGYR